MFWRVLLLALLALEPVAAVEPDFAREARLADEIVEVIFDGQAEWLDAGGRQFLAIHTEAAEPSAAVIILHGRGLHPDWADVVNPLRVGLVERGYSTLALQMPVLDKTATYYDYQPIFKFAHARIEAGIRFLRQRGRERVILLAHSCGAHMAMDWVGMGRVGGIDGYIGLGMGATDYGQPMLEPFPLAQLAVPILDLYGALDYPAVLRMAPQRKAQIDAAGNPRSAQLEVADSNHDYRNRGDELVTIVADWLDLLD